MLRNTLALALLALLALAAESFAAPDMRASASSRVDVKYVDSPVGIFRFAATPESPSAFPEEFFDQYSTVLGVPPPADADGALLDPEATATAVDVPGTRHVGRDDLGFFTTTDSSAELTNVRGKSDLDHYYGSRLFFDVTSTTTATQRLRLNISCTRSRVRFLTVIRVWAAMSARSFTGASRTRPPVKERISESRNWNRILRGPRAS